MRFRKTAGRILRAIAAAVAVCIILFYVCGAIRSRISGTPDDSVFGVSTSVVITGSMSPAINVDDFIICCRRDEYRTGDVITFFSEHGSKITHRIVGTADDGFITQGDANNIPDDEHVPAEHILGKVVCTIPKLGGIIAALRTPLGLAILFFAGFLLIFRARFIGGNDYDNQNGGTQNETNP